MLEFNVKYYLKAEMTAFLSLIFILMLSVIGAVIESASIQVTKNNKHGDMDRAVESVFAEYQRELLEQYDIFALEGTYETGTYSEEQIIERLSVYGAEHMEHEIERIQLLTDDGGRAFREQAIAYMKNQMGVTQLEELTHSSEKWKEQEEQIQELEKEGLGEQFSEAETELPKEDNPIEIISNIKKTGLLNVVIQNQSELSNKSISLETMPSQRSRRKGRGRFPVREDTDNATSGIYFGAYQLEKFAAADEPNEDGKLSYELEYIISGKSSDRENLEEVVRKLATLRFAPNYGYLMTDEAKKAEAEAMALVLTGIVSLPALTEVAKQAILLAWAFGESIMDIRTLLDGGKVELVKTKENWQLQLSALLELGTENDQTDAKHSENGLSYKEYLRMLLFMKSREESTMRSLDVVEMNMKLTLGEFFQVDQCVSKLKLQSRCHLRRGIYYEFSTQYGYQ